MRHEGERAWGGRFEPVAFQPCVGRTIRLVGAIPTAPDLEEVPVLVSWFGARPPGDLRAFLVKSADLDQQGFRPGDYLLVGSPQDDRPGRLTLEEIDGRYVMTRASGAALTDANPWTAARTIGPLIGVIRKRGAFRRAATPPSDAALQSRMSPFARLRGQLGMVESTYAVTRNPRLRRALKNEAALLRRRLQSGAVSDKAT